MARFARSNAGVTTCPTGRSLISSGQSTPEPDETVVFAWIEWPSKEVRDAGNKKIMEDPEMKNMDMPFDGKRMIFGGFDAIFDTAPAKG